MRDPQKLEAFVLADRLVHAVFLLVLPPEERFGLQSQIRRAAVSVAANLVEGCRRRSQREYMHHINIAHASAAEVEYLLALTHRLGMDPRAAALSTEFGRVAQMLYRLYEALEAA